jgi:hypothetical protein
VVGAVAAPAGRRPGGAGVERAGRQWTLVRVTTLIGRLFHLRYTPRGTSYLPHSHLHDVTVLSAIFFAGELVGFGAKARWMDVGAREARPPTRPRSTRRASGSGRRTCTGPASRCAGFLDFLASNICPTRSAGESTCHLGQCLSLAAAVFDGSGSCLTLAWLSSDNEHFGDLRH